jgi:hypothetical protein
MSPRIGQEHQRKQAGNLRIFGTQPQNHFREAYPLPRQIRPQQVWS